MRIKKMLLVLLAAVLPLSAQSQSDPYRFIELGPLDEAVQSYPLDINNRGQVVGRSGGWNSSECNAVLWENSIPTDLGPLDEADCSEARAINNLGQIVGFSGTSVSGRHYAVHAVLWDNGTITDLLMPPGDETALASGINDRGQIIGAGAGDGQYGLLWDNGTITKLEAIEIWWDPTASQYGRLGPFAAAYGINNRGQIVGVSTTLTGVHAVLWENGIPTDLGTLDGHNYSEAFGINERGQIMGISGVWADGCNAGLCSAVLWENGTIMDLGIPMSPAGLPYGINNSGQIVFTSSDRAVLWDKGTTTELGWGVAYGNNDRGQIVGRSDDFPGGAALWTR